MRVRDFQQILGKFTRNEKGTIISDCPIYIETMDGRLEEIRKIEFVDFSGRIVKPNKISRKKNQIKVNVSNLDKGIYILNLSSDKEVYKVKVIVE